MTDTSTTISLAPFVDALQPYLTAAVTAIVGAAVTLAAAKLNQWMGIKVDEANQAKLAKAISTQAGIALAKSATNLAGESIDAHSAVVASGANFVATNLKPLLTATGKTPDDVAHDIAGEIGKLQAAVPITPTVTLAPTPYRGIAS